MQLVSLYILSSTITGQLLYVAQTREIYILILTLIVDLYQLHSADY